MTFQCCALVTASCVSSFIKGRKVVLSLCNVSDSIIIFGVRNLKGKLNTHTLVGTTFSSGEWEHIALTYSSQSKNSLISLFSMKVA